MESLLELSKVCHWMNSMGFSPATSGNYSLREEDHFWISASGIDKGKIGPDDFIKMNFDGSYSPGRKPSDEALLHSTLYSLDSSIGCVLHSHSIPLTVLSMANGNELVIEGLEMQKALTGTSSHEEAVRLKIIDNNQDMNVLKENLIKVWELKYAFILRGHGLYTWGKTIQEAKRHVEGLEFLFSCQLELKRIANDQSNTLRY